MSEAKEYKQEEQLSENYDRCEVVVKDTSSNDFVRRVLAERRNNQPPISFEQMVEDLEREVVLYTLEKLRDQGVIGQVMYENAVEIALKT